MQESKHMEFSGFALLKQYKQINIRMESNKDQIEESKN